MLIMLTFLQFIAEELERWILHPKKHTTIFSPAVDKKTGWDILHWHMANKHDLPVGGEGFDNLERGGVHIERDALGKGKHRVNVNSYGKSGRNAPVPYEVIQHVKKRFPGAEVYDHNKNMKVN